MIVIVGRPTPASDRPISSPLTSARDRLRSVDQGDEDVSSRTPGRRAPRRPRPLIAEHPLTGIGLGADITFVSPLYNATAKLSDVDFTTIYVHDSYVWVALKMGLVAFVVFLALLLGRRRDAYRGYRSVSGPGPKTLMLGGLLTMLRSSPSRSPSRTSPTSGRRRCSPWPSP